MLTTADLTRMRSTVEAALPGTAVIHSGTYTSDGGGAGTIAYNPSGTVACRLDPNMAVWGESTEGERITPEHDVLVTLPHNADVGEADRLVIAGETYNVSTIRDRSWKLGTRIEARRLD